MSLFRRSILRRNWIFHILSLMSYDEARRSTLAWLTRLSCPRSLQRKALDVLCFHLEHSMNVFPGCAANKYRVGMARLYSSRIFSRV
jgi:hypothetical protein